MHREEEIVQRIEYDQVVIALRKDDILHVYFKNGCELTVAMQDQLRSAYAQLVGTKLTPCIFEGGEFVTITKEARENAIRIELITPVNGSAVIVKNLAQKLIADFYYKINKPNRPYKVFQKFDKGLEWLQQFNNDQKTDGDQTKTSTLVL